MRSARLLLALLALVPSLLRAEPVLELPAQPLSANILPHGAQDGSLPLAAVPPLASPIWSTPTGAAAADLQVRASLAQSVVAEAARLTALTEHMTYAEKSGAKLVLMPFDGQRLPQLAPDSLAQAEPEDRMIYMNWSMAGPDRYAFERAGLAPAAAERATALALAPVLGHELRHLKMRDDVGVDFPGLREEELVTHLDQAAAYDETLRREPGLAAIRPLLDRNFLYPHNEALMSRWRRSFGAAAEFILQKNSTLPSIADAARNLADARLWREKFASDPSIPPVWRERIARAVSFWSDPAAVKRVTDYLQARIDEAYQRYQRARAQ